jgi:hypothetical protein
MEEVLVNKVFFFDIDRKRMEIVHYLNVDGIFGILPAATREISTLAFQSCKAVVNLAEIWKPKTYCQNFVKNSIAVSSQKKILHLHTKKMNRSHSRRKR